MFKQLDNLSKIFYLGTIVPIFAALITPLLLNSSFLFPFITTKILFFRIIIEIALFFYVLLALRRPEFRPKFSKLTIAILIFFGLVTLASLFGTNLYRSFWGNIERGEGLLTIYHVLVFFFISVQTLTPPNPPLSKVGQGGLWFWFINGSILVSVITGVYALGQLFGSDAVIHTTGSRLASTIGNASFYAGYLLFGIFLSLWLFLKRSWHPGGHVLWRVYYALVVLFESFMLIQTETRGAFIGLAFGLVLVALLYLFSGKKGTTPKRLATGFLIAVVLVGSLIWTQKDSSFIDQIGILHRLTTISLDDVTTQSRLLTWDSSWQGVKDRPFLGVGWENYNVAFNKYFHAEIFRDAGSQIWFDRAHNIIFDVTVTSGIFGLLAYLSIFILSIRVLFMKYKRDYDLPTFAFLTGLLAAYFIQNMFVFDVLATYISFYTLLGLIVFLERGLVSSPENLDPAQNPTKFSDQLTKLAPAFGAVSFLILVLMIYSFNIKPAITNLKAVDALIAERLGKTQESSELFKDAINHNTYQVPEIRQKYAEFVMKLDPQKNDETFISKEFNLAINEIKENIRLNPFNVQHYLMLMVLYNRSDQYDSGRLGLAIKTSERAIELSPTRPQIYFELGQIYISLGDIPNALTTFEKAVELQPQAVESRWNLAAAYTITGNTEKAEAEFTALEELGFEYYSNSNLRRLTIVYTNAAAWDKLVDVYENLIIQEPNNTEFYAKLATTYQKQGELEKARATVLKAVELNPALAAEAEVFLQQLDEEENSENEDEETLIGE
jgi:tetratricopeptide (TPR) repeat protein/O-antigen ligase